MHSRVRWCSSSALHGAGTAARRRPTSPRCWCAIRWCGISKSRTARGGRSGVRSASSSGRRWSTSRPAWRRAAWFAPRVRRKSRRYLRADARLRRPRFVMFAHMGKLLCVSMLLLAVVAFAQAGGGDTDEAAYTASTLARILGGTARSHNDEAELAGAHNWYSTTATFTGHRRTPSGRFRPLISAWVGSRGQD